MFGREFESIEAEAENIAEVNRMINFPSDTGESKEEYMFCSF